MKHLIVVLVVILLFVSISCKKDKKLITKNLNTVLIGEIKDRPTDTLLLLTTSGDARSDVLAKIVVKNDSFNYTFFPEQIEAYQLVYQDEHDKGSWRPITFFAERDTIEFKIHDSEFFDDNEIKGLELNKEYKNYNAIMVRNFYSRYDSISQKYKSYDYKDFQSASYKDLMEKLRLAKTQEEKVPLYQLQKKLKEQGLDRSELGKIQDLEYKTLRTEMINYKYNYILKNLSLVSYELLLEDIRSFEYAGVEKEKVINAFNVLQKKFPEHKYTELGKNLLNGIFQLQPGGQYVNFIAPDIKGVNVELKSILKENDIVLLDLWATWCGPCIAKTRLARPIYEKYKDQGFTILGVAGERKNLNNYKAFMAKEQWAWQQLIELDKQNKIWEKYNVMNGGGGMFLIASSGEILAIDPSAEELEAILSLRLNSNKVKL